MTQAAEMAAVQRPSDDGDAALEGEQRDGGSDGDLAETVQEMWEALEVVRQQARNEDGEEDPELSEAIASVAHDLEVMVQNVRGYREALGRLRELDAREAQREERMTQNMIRHQEVTEELQQLRASQAESFRRYQEARERGQQLRALQAQTEEVMAQNSIALQETKESLQHQAQRRERMARTGRVDAGVIFSALIAGMWAALAGTALKLALDNNAPPSVQGWITEVASYDIVQNYATGLPLEPRALLNFCFRALGIASFMLASTRMWASFSSALAASEASLIPVIINFVANSVFSTLLELVVFGGTMSWQLVLGQLSMIIGPLFLVLAYP